MSTAQDVCECEYLSLIKKIWVQLTRREQSDLARDVDIITQEPPRRDVYSVSSTKSLSSVRLIERVETRWGGVPTDLRRTLWYRCQDLQLSRLLRRARA
ncbi:MAG: hypothetical protein U0930_22715 [Pirellulales bacterium]